MKIKKRKNNETKMKSWRIPRRWKNEELIEVQERAIIRYDKDYQCMLFSFLRTLLNSISGSCSSHWKIFWLKVYDRSNVYTFRLGF